MIKNVRIQIKKISIEAITVFAVFALFFVSVPVLSYADKISDLESKIKKVKEEREQTKTEIEKGKAELETLNSTQDTLKDTLESLNVNLKDVSNNLAVLDGQIEDKNAEILDMEQELIEAKKIENEQYRAMKKRIQYMYEARSYDAFETVVTAGSFREFLNRSNYIEAITNYDRRMLAKYRETLRVIGEAKELLEEEKDDLDELKQNAKSEQARVNELLERTNKSIASYEDEIAETEREVLAREEELKEQQSNLATLQAQLNEEKRLSQLAGSSAWRNISEITFAEGDRKLLANIIYCEAGNQSYEGQLAVGAVVINRVLSSVFPSTVVGVIYQNNQFSPVKSGRLALALAKDSATESCYRAADAAMTGQTNVNNCLFFRTPIAGLNGIRIGGHVFY